MRMARSGKKVCYADATQYHLFDTETAEDMVLFPHHLVAGEAGDDAAPSTPSASSASLAAGGVPAQRRPQIELIDSTDFMLASLSRGTPRPMPS